MKITVADYSEFIDKYFDAHGDTLEIIFSSAYYEDGVFNVTCDDGFKQVAVRGREITTFVDSPVNVCGDDISVNNLLFDTRRISDALLRARVKNSVTISRCAILRAFLSEEPGTSVLSIEPLATSSRLTLSDSWLIRNLTLEGHHILGLGAMTDSAFSSLTFASNAFIDNRSDYVIGALAAAEINIRDCFVWLRDEKTVFLGARTPGADITISGSTIIAPSMRQVATQWASHAAPGDFNPVLFQRCHIYVTESDVVPDNFHLVDTTVSKVPPLPDDEFEAWAATQEASARHGDAPEAKALRRSLHFN